jgi:putative sigma-54 modulation protein
MSHRERMNWRGLSRVPSLEVREGAVTITVRSFGIDVDADMGGLVERRLSFALSRFGRRVRHVSVALVDVNGPRGGIDKKCAMHARLAPRGKVRVEDRDSEVAAAVDRAAGRLARAVGRALERRREGAKGSGLRRRA